MQDPPPTTPHLARLVARSDPVRRRLMWSAECACGWATPPDADSTLDLDQASAHDGMPLSLVDRGFTVIGPDDA